MPVSGPKRSTSALTTCSPNPSTNPKSAASCITPARGRLPRRPRWAPYNGFSTQGETMSAATDAFVKDNRHRLLEELKQFLRIPSISTLPENRADVERAANFVADALRTAGMENVELIQTDKHPLVYADWLHAPGKPTVLCYGHYDVQPADPLELWASRRWPTSSNNRPPGTDLPVPRRAFLAAWGVPSGPGSVSGLHFRIT